MPSMFVLKQLGRSLHRSVLWVLLLSMVIGFITVGFGQWYASRENLAYADNVYTTIAAIDDRDFWRSTPEAWYRRVPETQISTAPGEFEQHLEYRDKSKPDPHQLYLDKVAGLEMVIQVDDRRSSRVYSPEAATVVHPLEDIDLAMGRERARRAGDYEEMVFISIHGNYYPYYRYAEGLSPCVLAGRCVSFEITGPGSMEADYIYKMGISRLYYSAIFEIDHTQSPALHPIAQELKYYRISSAEIGRAHV